MLIDYLPEIMQEIREIKVTIAAQQPEFVKVWNETHHALLDQFVCTATENGIARWEKILSIIPKGSQSLDTRRFRILTRLNEKLPYTAKTLAQQLESLCGKNGFSLTLNHDNYAVFVMVNLIAKNNFEDVRRLLNGVVPANMTIDLKQKYNDHMDVALITHKSLSRYSYYNLRNEVLTNA